MNKKYYRSRSDRRLTGVCGGLAEYFNIDPLLVRIGFIFLIFAWGGGLLVYLMLTILAEER